MRYQLIILILVSLSYNIHAKKIDIPTEQNQIKETCQRALLTLELRDLFYKEHISCVEWLHSDKSRTIHQLKTVEMIREECILKKNELLNMSKNDLNDDRVNLKLIIQQIDLFHSVVIDNMKRDLVRQDSVTDQNTFGDYARHMLPLADQIDSFFDQAIEGHRLQLYKRILVLDSGLKKNKKSTQFKAELKEVKVSFDQLNKGYEMKYLVAEGLLGAYRWVNMLDHVETHNLFKSHVGALVRKTQTESYKPYVNPELTELFGLYKELIAGSLPSLDTSDKDYGSKYFLASFLIESMLEKYEIVTEGLSYELWKESDKLNRLLKFEGFSKEQAIKHLLSYHRESFISILSKRNITLDRIEEEKLMNKLVKVYSDKFTEEEVKEITIFYQSKAGQKYQKLSSLIWVEMLLIMNEYLREVD